MSLFFRFREVAGSLEASLTDGLEDAPGKLSRKQQVALKGLTELTSQLSPGPEHAPAFSHHTGICAVRTLA